MTFKRRLDWEESEPGRRKTEAGSSVCKGPDVRQGLAAWEL